MEVRTGTGIDFHRLVSKQESQTPLLLGAVEIPGDLTLLGHSDADIVLHALSDALLGALGEADIGSFFSDRDPKNKGLDSKKILSLALQKLIERKFKISNIDISLLGEKPRISPHRQAICLSLASLCSLREDQVSIKASTTEKMGALGRQEGLACLANVLIKKTE